MQKIMVATLFLVLMSSCSYFTSIKTRTVASTDTSLNDESVKLFRHQDASDSILGQVEGLAFADDKSKGESIGKIIGFIVKNRKQILNTSETKIPILRFSPDTIKIINDSQSVSLRLQQVMYFYREKDDGNREKILVPFEGADIVAIIKNGKLESLNSSLVIPPEDFQETITMMKTATIEDLKISSIEDRISLFNTFLSVPDEEEQAVAFNKLFPKLSEQDNKGWLKRFMNDPEVFYKLSQESSSSTRLTFVKPNSSSFHELVWKIQSPLGLPIHYYFSADKKKEHKYVKSMTLLSDVAVKIYRGFLIKPDLLLIKRGNSEEYAQRPIKKSTATKQAITNLSKVVEYYKKDFNWNSYDNQGSPLVATVKMGGKHLKGNAAWVRAPFNQFIFGKDGSDLANLTGALDVIGHEYFHSVLSNTVELDYSGEQGALNEHLADIFGVGFESDITGTPYDQRIGENALVKNRDTPNKYSLRDFLNPDASLTEQAKNMDEVNQRYGKFCTPDPQENDNCGVHESNGVLNLVIGKLIQNKGWNNVKHMLYQTATKRLRPSSDFMDYRNQILEECKSTSGMSNSDCLGLSKDFAAVGLVAPDSTPSIRSEIDTDICNMIRSSCEILRRYGVDSTRSCQKCGF